MSYKGVVKPHQNGPGRAEFGDSFGFIRGVRPTILPFPSKPCRMPYTLSFSSPILFSLGRSKTYLFRGYFSCVSNTFISCLWPIMCYTIGIAKFLPWKGRNMGSLAKFLAEKIVYCTIPAFLDSSTLRRSINAWELYLESWIVTYNRDHKNQQICTSYTPKPKQVKSRKTNRK